MTHAWSIAGADGQVILGATDMPSGDPTACLVIMHGFKGYKDYGMLPRIAREVAAAGLVVHRFNFSHSGMTNEISSFARPDLFERDTWNKQVFDLLAVLRAIRHGELAGAGLPLFLLGHSRGGVTAILTAGRLTEPGTITDPGLAGVITLAAPSQANPFTPTQQADLMTHGFLDSPSSRTGQVLRVGRAFLQDQLDDPERHDVLKYASRLPCRLLVVHGDIDETVSVEHAYRLAGAAGDRGRLQMIRGADHVLNTPNPLPETATTGRCLRQAVDGTLGFISNTTSRRNAH